MDAFDLPSLGTLAIGATLVAASYTLAVSLAAGRGRPGLLPAARWGVYATTALSVIATLLLAYAFQVHDFRIRYVARYSDSSMEWWYLLTSLWGGQDGSLLFWSFLLVGWSALCVRWMRDRWPELAPWVIATLMGLVVFFQILMLFAANPFALMHAGVPADGEGLNPLLRSYWMIIHPPALYMGFVGWSVPFAFVVAALITGRLHDEWIRATRRWTLAAWLSLSMGLLIGAVWSYEELGWGGYWAWDPVENASFMPWLVGTAFLHSVMMQERYGMLKVWNVFLLCLTFLLTIFGTFLTRSGLIASVHSFAKSDIGIFFVWFLVLLTVGCAALIVWRLPRLKAEHRIQSMVSREFSFLLNNWILLAITFAVLILTTFPLISEWIEGEEVTVGPAVYNRWMIPFGIVLLILSGVGPVISWRKATGRNLAKAFTYPVLAAGAVGALHLVFGAGVGLPPFVESAEIYSGTATGTVLQGVYRIAPLVSVMACAFVLGTIVQEFWRGTAVRVRTKAEPAWTALAQLVGRNRRRYGGYLVHVAIVLMYLGFTGAAYDQEAEAALYPGEQMTVGGYVLAYQGLRQESEQSKQMIFTDLEVSSNGRPLGRVSPAKFVYRSHPQMPTTEVAIRSGAFEDLYVINSTADPRTQRATFRVVVRPLVVWIWIGGLLLVLGTAIGAFPSVRELLAESRSSARPRAAAGPSARPTVVEAE